MSNDLLAQYTTGWNEAVGARLTAALLGVLIGGYVLRRVWKRRGSVVGSILWFLLAAGLIVFALWPQDIVDFIIRTPYETRVRFNVGAVSILVLLITFESIRKTHLQERYALLWMATAIFLFTSALFPHTVDLFRALTGMEYATALVAVAFTFLVLVAFHFSISISSSRSNQAKIAQRVAILEERLRRLEKQAGSGLDGATPRPENDLDETEGHPT
jgi:hypothetical protein